MTHSIHAVSEHSPRNDVKNKLGRKIIVSSAVVIALNVLGNFALSRGMHEVGVVETWSPMPYIRAFAHPWVVLGVLMMTGWFLSRLVLLSFADLSFAVPITSLSYVFTAIVGVLLLHDRVDFMDWVGICLVAFGAAVVGRTQPQTTHEREIEP